MYNKHLDRKHSWMLLMAYVLKLNYYMTSVLSFFLLFRSWSFLLLPFIKPDFSLQARPFESGRGIYYTFISYILTEGGGGWGGQVKETSDWFSKEKWPPPLIKRNKLIPDWPFRSLILFMKLRAGEHQGISFSPACVKGSQGTRKMEEVWKNSPADRRISRHPAVDNDPWKKVSSVLRKTSLTHPCTFIGIINYPAPNPNPPNQPPSPKPDLDPILPA